MAGTVTVPATPERSRHEHSVTHHPPARGRGRAVPARPGVLPIRELIVTLDLPPGSLVSERDSDGTARLGRTPVREALRALARERLVDVYPRRGMFVSGVDVRDLAGLSEVRLTLESRRREARRRASDGRRPSGDRHASSRSSRQTRGALDERKLIDLDQRIHRHIYECTHNPFLEATLNEYYVLTLRIWFLALDRVVRLDEAR